MGKRNRGKWAAPTQDERINKKRTFTLTPEVHEKLNVDAKAKANISAICDKALRRHYGVPLIGVDGECS